MFDQVRVDGGTEFYLILAMQEHLQEYRQNRDRECFRQTQSKKV